MTSADVVQRAVSRAPAETFGFTTHSVASGNSFALVGFQTVGTTGTPCSDSSAR